MFISSVEIRVFGRPAPATLAVALSIVVPNIMNMIIRLADGAVHGRTSIRSALIAKGGGFRALTAARASHHFAGVKDPTDYSPKF